MALSATPKVAIEFDAGVWTDVSADARSAQSKRGRGFELDSFSAGRATVTLDNRTRKYDPEYSAGAYYGKLLPRKRIRVGFVYSGTTYWKFYGYIDGWPQAYNGPRDATVTVSATDAFKVFAGAQVPSVWQQVAEAATTTTAWYRLGEGSGTTAADAHGSLHGTYNGGATFNSRAGLVFGDSNGAIGFDGVDDYVDLPFAAAVDTNAAFSIEFWIQKSEAADYNDEVIFEQSQGQQVDTDGMLSVLVRGSASGLDGQVNAAFINGGSSGVLDSGVRVDDGAVHHVVVTADGATLMKLYIDGVLVDTDGYTPLTSAVSWLRIGDGRNGSGVADDGFHLKATLDELILHNDDLSAADITARYVAGTAPWEGDTPKARIDRVLDYIDWLSADRDLDTGSALLLAANLETDALSHLQAVELSEGGRFFIDRNGKATLVGRQNAWSEAVYNTSNATFGDSGSELKYTAKVGDLFGFDDAKLVNEARVRQYNASEQVATDAASITAYGLATRSEETLEQRPGVVQNRAEYLVYKFKDPVLRMPSVEIKPERSPSTLYALLGANDLGYRYTFKRRPQGVGSAISKEFHVESETLTMTPSDVTVTWELSPAEPSFWIWGTSTWETGTSVARWGY